MHQRAPAKARAKQRILQDLLSEGGHDGSFSGVSCVAKAQKLTKSVSGNLTILMIRYNDVK